jgi:hypothetical protein
MPILMTLTYYAFYIYAWILTAIHNRMRLFRVFQQAGSLFLLGHSLKWLFFDIEWSKLRTQWCNLQSMVHNIH